MLIKTEASLAKSAKNNGIKNEKLVIEPFFIISRRPKVNRMG